MAYCAHCKRKASAYDDYNLTSRQLLIRAPPRPRLAWRTPTFWKENYEFVLAAITLVALLTGWIGGEVTGTAARLGGRRSAP